MYCSFSTIKEDHTIGTGRGIGYRSKALRKAMVLESTISCPQCGTAKTERMPADACRIFYQCSGCGAVLRPKPGDCCVFCSYGSVPCPPIQAARARQAGGGSGYTD
jgi:rubredoxin